MAAGLNVLDGGDNLLGVEEGPEWRAHPRDDDGGVQGRDVLEYAADELGRGVLEQAVGELGRDVLEHAVGELGHDVLGHDVLEHAVGAPEHDVPWGHGSDVAT